MSDRDRDRDGNRELRVIQKEVEGEIGVMVNTRIPPCRRV